MPASVEPRRVLILGGSGEAAALAWALAEVAGVAATVSLAGVTRNPVPLPIPTRSGGFGGVEGLITHLRTECVTHLVDATHPFAAQISAHAVAAAESVGVPLLRLSRPPWAPEAGDHWIEVADAAGAAGALPAVAARVFLAIGRRDLAPFSVRPDIQFLVRMIEPPANGLPLLSHRLVLARGPFEIDAERDLFRRLRVEVVVAKNAGGTGARAKLAAARALSLPVVMIRRPALPPAPEATRVEQVVAWIGA